MQVVDIVNEFCNYMEKEGIHVVWHISKSKRSAYISLDYGMLPSVRVSNHLKYKSSSFKYSIISSLEERREIVNNGNVLIFVPYSKGYIEDVVSELVLLRRQQQVKLGLSKFNSMTPRKNILYNEDILNIPESIVFERMGRNMYNSFVAKKKKRR